jgi:feruloyl esterase
MILNYGRISVANAAPGAWPNKAKQQLLTSSVTAACDALDGAVDGIVSDIAACTFDPATIRCPGGADTGNTCLSDPQIAAVSSYAGTLTVPYPLANGTTTYPAYNVFTGAADLSSGLGLGTVAPSTPSTFSMPFPFYIYEPFIRYWVTLDANYDSLTFSLNSNAAFFKQRLQYISSRLDVTPDLSAFAARGGKVIIVHGRADPVIPTASSEDFYARLVTAMGAPQVSSFLKLYEVPGYGHGSGVFNTSWDSIAALETWVEHGTAPTAVVVRDANASSNSRTRPLCEAPLWPKYNGTGDINLAASYTCSP